MTPALRRAGAMLAAEGRDRLVLRGAILAQSLLASVLTYALAPRPEIGADPARLPLVLLALLAVSAAAVPDSAVVLGLLAGHIAVWGIFLPRPEGAADLVWPGLLAVLLLGVHQSSSALGVWPPGATIPRSARCRWLRHAAAVAGATLVVTAAAALLLAAAPPGLAWVTVLGLVALGAGAVAAYVKSV